jgi:hypothetical protein
MTSPSKNFAEGRAIMVRPSLCLIALVTALLVLAFAAPIAQAEQPEPVALTGTNPISSQAKPAASITPLIEGRGDGAIISVVKPIGLSTRSPIASAGTSPANEVDIYANAACTGSPVQNGIIEELEGEGIQVEVIPDSSTTFSAIQIDPTDPTHPSVCSKPITYWNSSSASEPPQEEPPKEEPPKEEPPAEPPVTKPPATGERPGTSPGPPVPPRLHTIPSGRANDNTPELIGSAPGADAVKIFTNSSCSGAPLDTVSAKALTAGVEAHVADNSTTDFAGISIANGKQSFCSPPATYIEDSTPPHVRITMGPGAKTRRHKAVFRFADAGEDPLGTSFQCRVNHKKWKACHSPLKLSHLEFHRYTFRVRGTDAIGNAGAKPARRSFKVIP